MTSTRSSYDTWRINGAGEPTLSPTPSEVEALLRRDRGGLTGGSHELTPAGMPATLTDPDRKAYPPMPPASRPAPAGTTAAAGRGWPLLTEAKRNADEVIDQARHTADQIRNATLNALADALDQTQTAATGIMREVTVEAEHLRQAARADADRIEREATAWLDEQRETVSVLGRQCREEAHAEAARLRREARERSCRDAEQERNEVAAAAVADTVARTRQLIDEASRAVAVVLTQLTGQAGAFDRLLEESRAQLRSCEQELTTLVPKPAPATDPIAPGHRPPTSGSAAWGLAAGPRP